MATVKPFTRVSGIPQRTPGTGDMYPGTNEADLKGKDLWNLPEGWRNDYAVQTDSYMSSIPTSMSGNSRGRASDKQALEDVKNMKHMTPEQFQAFKKKMESKKDKGLTPIIADEYIRRLVTGAK